MFRQICKGGDMTRCCLYSDASILFALAGVTPQRDMTRRKDSLVMWLDQHCDALEPFLNLIEVRPPG
jgi:hypothetical protein